ncbi:MAG TPA: site-2 protease family protein [Holophagaceae bacterium]|nr:site-2 protease family protein [Holophagaceae bacterium]
MFENISLQTILVTYVAMLFSLSVHEASHATAAYWLEDDTARRLGRMTLNPIAHMDILGTLILPLLGMLSGWRILGWAKPVPVDPRHLSRKFTQRVGMAMVAGAGPASNLLLSLLFIPALGLVIRMWTPEEPFIRMNVFNAAMFAKAEAFHRAGGWGPGEVLTMMLLGRLVIINIGLAIFNLLPVGPLDGASILRGFLPWRWLPTFDRIQPTISIILLIGFFLGFIGYLLLPFFYVAERFYLNPFARLVLGV